MVFKRKLVRLKPVEQIISTVFLGSLLITIVQSSPTTMDPAMMTELITDIINTSDKVSPSVSSPSILTTLTSVRGGSSIAASVGSTRNPSTPSSSNLPSTLNPSSTTSAILSTIPNSATTSSETKKSASPADQRTIPGEATTIVQGSTVRATTTGSHMLSTEAVTTSGFQKTTLNDRSTSLNSGTTPGSQVITSNEQSSKIGTTSSSLVTTLSGQTSPSSSDRQTVTPAATSHDRTTAATSSKPPDTVTTNRRTLPANTGDRTPSMSATVKITQSTEKVSSSTDNVASTEKVASSTTKPPRKTTKPSIPLKTTTDMKPTDSKGTVSSSSSTGEPLLTIPQWFAVFLGTFLTIFLIFLTNIWYKAKMTPDTTKPSIELIKNVQKNDRPKSWQENNVPLEFMSLHIELPKETTVEMKCAENLAFEGDQADNPGTSFEVVTLTKL